MCQFLKRTLYSDESLNKKDKIYPANLNGNGQVCRICFTLSQYTYQ